MISIYTRSNNYFSKEYIKWILRKIIRKRTGPEIVLESLLRCLDIEKIPYEVNPKTPKYKIVHVLSGVNALKYAIRIKQQKKIEKIIAGPNLVIFPDEANQILFNENIDAILLPSIWVVDFYKKYLPEKQHKKIEVWPASVPLDIQNQTNYERNKILVFIKTVDENLLQEIRKFLRNTQLPFEEIIYGHYKQGGYFSALKESKLMVYLQIVESQGMALEEAWSRNVPTLVLEKTSFTYPDGRVALGQVSAPYLTKESGLFFRDFEDFKKKLKNMIENIESFTPRKYYIENLSDQVVAQKYVKIVNKLK